MTFFYTTHVLCKITVNKHSVQQKTSHTHCPYLHRTQHKSRRLSLSCGAAKMDDSPHGQLTFPDQPSISLCSGNRWKTHSVFSITLYHTQDKTLSYSKHTHSPHSVKVHVHFNRVVSALFHTYIKELGDKS